MTSRLCSFVNPFIYWFTQVRSLEEREKNTHGQQHVEMRNLRYTILYSCMRLQLWAQSYLFINILPKPSWYTKASMRWQTSFVSNSHCHNRFFKSTSSHTSGESVAFRFSIAEWIPSAFMGAELGITQASLVVAPKQRSPKQAKSQTWRSDWNLNSSPFQNLTCTHTHNTAAK